jgi:hypothetical protein
MIRIGPGGESERVGSGKAFGTDHDLIARAHNATITARPRPGGGLEMSVTILTRPRPEGGLEMSVTIPTRPG